MNGFNETAKFAGYNFYFASKIYFYTSISAENRFLDFGSGGKSEIIKEIKLSDAEIERYNEIINRKKKPMKELYQLFHLFTEDYLKWFDTIIFEKIGYNQETDKLYLCLDSNSEGTEHYIALQRSHKIFYAPIYFYEPQKLLEKESNKKELVH